MDTPEQTENDRASSQISTDNFQAKPENSEKAQTVPYLSWKPFYLRPWVLSVFIGILSSLIVVVEVLLAVSARSSGLSSSTTKFRYTWAYAPTTVLIILGAAWARVSFQAMLVAPWLALNRQPWTLTPATTRDYFSMLQPVALYKSFKHGDFAVTATSFVSLLFTAMIAFSAGLITLSSTELTTTGVPVSVENKFVDGISQLNTTLAVAPNLQTSVIGFLRAGLPYPPGLTPEVAYENVSPNAGANMQVLVSKVDGLSASLDCQPAILEAPLWDLGEYLASVAVLQPVDVTLKSTDCQVNISIHRPLLDLLETKGEESRITGYFASLGTGKCNGSKGGDDAMRFGLVLGSVDQRTYSNWREQGGSPGTIQFVNSTQLICTPNYSINRYSLTQNGTTFLDLTLDSDFPPRKLNGLHAWDLASAYVALHPDANPVRKDISFEPMEIYVPALGASMRVDRYLLTAMVASSNLPSNITSFLNPDHLSQFFRDHYRSYIASIAHYLMPSSSLRMTEGVSCRTENRLIVQPLAAHTISSLLGAAILLVVAVLLCSRRHYIHRCPSTIIDAAAILSSHRAELETLGATTLSLRGRSTSAGPCTRTCSRLSQGPSAIHSRLTAPSTYKSSKNYHPFSLHPLARLGTCLLLIGIILSLVLLLRKSSMDSQGLGDGSSNGPIQYLWRVFPAFVFSLMGMNASAGDFATRALIPFLNLKRGSLYARSLGVGLLDQLQIKSLYQAGRLRLYPALVSGIVAMLTATLPMFSAPLFGVELYPRQFQTNLTVTSVFDYIDITIPRVVEGHGQENVPGFSPILAQSISSLVLQHNLSFPPFTYQDLAFPTFQLSNDARLNWSGVAVEAVIPALQCKLACKLYDSQDVEINVTQSEDKAWRNMSSITVNNERQIVSADMGTFQLPLLEVNGVFGLGHFKYQGGSDYLYTWGKFLPARNNPRISIFAMGCNATLYIVDAAVYFVSNGDTLLIDSAKPPVIDERSRRLSRSRLASEDQTSISAPGDLVPQWPPRPDVTLDNFFSVLTTSPYGVPLSALAGKTHNEAQVVAEAIQTQQRMIAAQKYSQAWRIAVDSSNFTSIDPAMAIDGRDPTAPFPALAINVTGSPRVIQDPASTYVIISVLGTILLLAIISWALTRDAAVIGGSATDIAYLYSLLLPGGILEALPDNAWMLNDKELEQVFPPDARFRLGPQTDDDAKAQSYMIYQERPLEVDDLIMRDDDEQTVDQSEQDPVSGASLASEHSPVSGI
ncbi:hypothetical protein QBC44DRAFT_405220 [Cladorrhinum sp. PSN332]|nr:hypothetical protein QBC44DRAFT_405220 [Cladorrhinum sp. PSN332]